jgi:hypothetical protein
MTKKSSIKPIFKCLRCKDKNWIVQCVCGRRCSNPGCKTPNETYIKPNGRPEWLINHDEEGKWYCKKCARKIQYHKKKKKSIAS